MFYNNVKVFTVSFDQFKLKKKKKYRSKVWGHCIFTVQYCLLPYVTSLGVLFYILFV